MSDERREQLRLFVACELPEDARDALGRIQRELRGQGAEGLRWVGPDSIHLTLKFLGGVDESRVGDVTAALRDAVEPFEARVSLAHVGGFGGARLRVVWVGLDGDTEALASLARGVDEALQPLGFPRERRPFTPHLTLARVRDRVSPQERKRLADLIEQYRSPHVTPMILTEARLMQSILRPGGSVYRGLATLPKPK